MAFATSKTFVFYGLVEIMFGLWLYTILVNPRFRLNKKTLIIFSPFVVYVIWFAITSFTAISPNMSIWSSFGRGTGLLTMVHILGLAFIVASLFVYKGFKSYGQKLLNYFLAGGFIMSLSVWLGNEGFNLGVKFLQESKGGGLIGNSSLSAIYLLFVFFLALFLFFKNGADKGQKIWSSLVMSTIILSPLFLDVYGLLNGQSMLGSARASLIGLVAGLTTAILIYLATSKKKALKIVGIAGIVLGVISSVFIYTSLLKSDTVIHQKFGAVAGENRFIFWDISKKALEEKPILGFGPENYSIVYQKYFDPSIYQTEGSVEVWNDKAHNVFFEIGVSSGWVGIVLYILFLVSLFYGVYVSYRNNKTNRIQIGVLFGLLVSYIISNLFAFDSLTSLLGLSIFVGLVFGLNQDIFEKETVVKESTKLAVFVMVTVLIILGIVFFVIKPIGKAKTIVLVNSMSLNTRPDHYVDFSKYIMKDSNVEFADIADDMYRLYSKSLGDIKENEELLSYAQKDLEKFLQFLETTIDKDDYNYKLYLSTARLYNISIILGSDKSTDKLSRILDLENKAKVLSPDDPQVYWTTAESYAIFKDYSKSIAELQTAIEIDPHLAWSHKLLIKLAKDLGHQELYNESLNRAKDEIPGFSL